MTSPKKTETIIYNGHRLYRIKALRDVRGMVKAAMSRENAICPKVDI